MSDPTPEPAEDWSTATFEGARREQLRRWSQLSLRQVIAALEEMEQLANRLGTTTTASQPQPQPPAKQMP